MPSTQGAEETCALRCASQQAGVALASALDAISEARKLRDQRSLFARKTDAGSAELYFHCAHRLCAPSLRSHADRTRTSKLTTLALTPTLTLPGRGHRPPWRCRADPCLLFVYFPF